MAATVTRVEMALEWAGTETGIKGIGKGDIKGIGNGDIKGIGNWDKGTENGDKKRYQKRG